MKIKVKPEGRTGVYIADKESLIDFLIMYDDDVIHNQVQSSGMILGADHDKQSVIEDVKNADQLAVLTGSAYLNNLRHALSIITNNQLSMFDIGEIKDDDLQIEGEQI